MKGYDRYYNLDSSQYDKKRSISNFLMKSMGDRAILPIIQCLSNKKILEVGLGTGNYTKILLELKNDVTGVDINPDLGKNLPIKIFKSKADEFSLLFFQEKFDVVCSFWMIDYLNKSELEGFVKESTKVLSEKGIFLSTIPRNAGWGKLHIVLSGLKGFRKYGYSKNEIEEILKKEKFSKYRIISMQGRLGLPFAWFVVANKS